MSDETASEAGTKPKVKIMTFGFSHGIPEFPGLDPETVCVIDARQMNDPSGQVKGKDGTASAVQEFIKAQPMYAVMAAKAMEAAKAGKMIVFGDGGGIFRSVGMAMITVDALIAEGFEVEVEHRDLHGGGQHHGPIPDIADDDDSTEYSGGSVEEGEEEDRVEKYLDAFHGNKNKKTAADLLEVAAEEDQLTEVAEAVITWLRD